jgi:hypothetical protein
MVTVKPRDSNTVAKEAAAMPLPNDETTPPVTKINRVITHQYWLQKTVAIIAFLTALGN